MSSPLEPIPRKNTPVIHNRETLLRHEPIGESPSWWIDIAIQTTAVSVNPHRICEPTEKPEGLDVPWATKRSSHKTSITWRFRIHNGVPLTVPPSPPSEALLLPEGSVMVSEDVRIAPRPRRPPPIGLGLTGSVPRGSPLHPPLLLPTPPVIGYTTFHSSKLVANILTLTVVNPSCILLEAPPLRPLPPSGGTDVIRRLIRTHTAPPTILSPLPLPRPMRGP